jgi:FkbM family methyltransferase
MIGKLVNLEHGLNDFVLKSRMPLTLKKLYGLFRNHLGRELYRAQFLPLKSSPNYIISTILEKGDHYIDIGAEEGHMMALASVAVGKRGRVFAFEPRQSAVDLLKVMISDYELNNVTLYQNLLGTTNGEVEMFENSDHPSSSSLYSEWGGGHSRTYTMTTLDSWAERNQVHRTDLIKMDVEGAEMQVLEGGKRFLKETQPMLILEIRDQDIRLQKFGYDADDVLKLLRSVGYNNFFSLRSIGLVAINKRSDILDSDHDMLAVCENENARKKLKQICVV